MNMTGSHKISNFNPSDIVLPEKEASALVLAVCERLDAASIGYCVERNYQGYPDVLTGDVDLIIGHSDIIFVAKHICDVAKANGWLCYQHHIWERTAYLGLCFDGLPSRFTLTIELFSGARWHGVPFLDGVTVINDRLRHGITWKPSPGHQIIITVMHHLLYNGCVPNKYRDEISSLMGLGEESVEANLTPFFGRYYAKKVTKQLIRGDWQYFDKKIARRLKALLLLRAFILRPLTTLNDVKKGLVSHFGGPEGVAIIIDTVPDSKKDALIESMLGIMIKWHVFKPPRREVVRASVSAFRTKRRVAKILSSGGVVLFDHEPAGEFIGKSSLPEYKIVQSDKLLVFCQSVEIFSCSESLNTEGGNVDRVALEVLNAILCHRAALNEGFGCD